MTGDRRRWLSAAAVVLLAPVLGAGCSGADPAPAPREAPAAEGSVTPSTAPGERYVALGDSFTAAPGVGEPAGPRGCLQSDVNYPRLLADRLGLDLVDVSCGGATSRDLRRAQAPGVPPQLRAVTPGTVLVTVSIGANDGGLYRDLVLSCAGFRDMPPRGGCGPVGRFAPDRLDAELAQLATRTGRTVRAVRDRAPDARVVVVDYPQLAPDGGACATLRMSGTDLAFVHDVNRRLSEALREGARRGGGESVDMWAASAGHDACAEDPWVAGMRPVRPGVPIHPYAEHQVAVADELEALLG